jgi:hypothetical protein
MFWFYEKSYKSTLAILRGKAALAPIFAELKQFVEGEFGVTVYNITYVPYGIFNKPKKGFLNYGKRMSLDCWVSSYEESEKMQKITEVESVWGDVAYSVSFDEQKQAVVLDKFLELAEKYGYAVGAKAEEISVIYPYWFPMRYMSRILFRVEWKTNIGVFWKYKKAGVWRIYSNGYSVVVFYRTDAQKAINEENGISDAIRKEYFSAVKKVDELDFYKEEYITFDSKENLDKNYEGNLFWYFK